MRISKILIMAAAVLVTSLFVVATSAVTPSPTNSSLAIEIDLAKPFYVPAGKTTMVVIRVPDADASSTGETVSAIKLEPRMMQGDKVKVTVYALIGEPDKNIKSCREWDALRSTFIASYVAGVDDEVSLDKLREFGVRLGKDPLTFRVVPRRTLSPVPQDFGSTGCDCASCGGLICCPNPGHCIGCGSCGQVCCSGS